MRITYSKSSVQTQASDNAAICVTAAATAARQRLTAPFTAIDEESHFKLSSYEVYIAAFCWKRDGARRAMAKHQTEIAEPNFRLLFEACPHPYLVLRTDPAFTIVAVDDNYLAATGTDRPSVLGRGVFDVFPDNPSDGTATGVSDLRISLERVVREKAQDVMGVQKYDIPSEQGADTFTVRYWSPVNTPVFGDDGSVVMIIHHVEDITEFVLERERASQNAANGTELTQNRLARMEAEVLRRAGEVKAANRQIKAMVVEEERRSQQQRDAELARMDERLYDLGLAKAELLATVFHRIVIPQTLWARYLVAVAIFGAALVLRVFIPVEVGLAFVTFYPATAITVFLCGRGPGLLSVFLGLIFGYIAFMPPHWTLKFRFEDLPALVIFAVSGILICTIIDEILRAAGKVSTVNRQLGATMEALKQDTAERKRTEQALRDSEKNFRTSFAYASIGKALVAPDQDGHYLQVNPAFCLLLSYTEEELLDLTSRDITHPDDWEFDRIQAQDLIDGRLDSYTVEKRYFRKNCEIVWVLLSVSLLRDKDGCPVHFIVQIQNVTEQKRSDERTKRLRRIVTMMSAGHKAVVEAADEPTLFRAMCDVVVECGGYRMAWMGLVEHDEAKTVRPVAHAGHEADYLAVAAITWDDGPLSVGPTGMSVRTGQAQINSDFATNPAMSSWRDEALQRGYRSSISLPLKDGSNVFGVLTLYAHEPDAFGAAEVKLLLELADDVAYGVTALRIKRDRDELERVLFQAQKMESLGQLTGGIAHDFNNLLQVILSNLDLSLKALNGSTAVSGYLQNAIAGAEQGAKLTGHLLAYARRQPLSPEPVRVDRLVSDMTNVLRRTIGETIDIELVTSGGLWPALVDSNQLQNALLNLAINARDAMQEGGKLTIELANTSLDLAYAKMHREVKVGQYVMVAITDTGIGMSTAILDRVFEPFFTTKPEGRGTGLGLSMVYGFVKQSGGHIKIYSEVGLGTTIKLYLPRSLQSEIPHFAVEAKAAGGNGETILVAEDDDGVRASVVTQLVELGYRVLAVANGEAALEILRRAEHVDLLFTDVVMPGTLNGRALADKAKELNPALAIVFTSGYTENAIIHHGRLDEGVILLSKPYRLAQLADTIRMALASPPVPTAQSAPATNGPGIAQLASAAEPHCAPPTGHILLVDDDELLRDVLASCLVQLGYRVLAAGTPSEALTLLAEAPQIQVMISDFTLPEMNGIALAREVLARSPTLPIILATGHQLESKDLPDPAIQILVKPFRTQTLRSALAAALRRHEILARAGE